MGCGPGGWLRGGLAGGGSLAELLSVLGDSVVVVVVLVVSVVVVVVVDVDVLLGAGLVPPPLPNSCSTPYAISPSRINTSSAQPISAAGLRYHGRVPATASGSSGSNGPNWSGGGPSTVG